MAEPTEADRAKARDIIRENTFGWPESEGVEELTEDQERHVEILACLIADTREQAAEAEAKRWQDAIDEVVYAEDPERDGSGCDSGDPMDVTITEIRGAFNVWHNRLHDQKLRLVGTGREAKISAPEGHVLTDDGVVRKVLGSLPVTADGCVVGVENDHHCADLWHLDDMPVFVRPEWKSFPGFSKCYSTRTAAESAHEAAGE